MKQIIVTVQRGENLTAAGLMKRYSNQIGTEFRRSCYGAAEIVIDGKPYQYHHWSITVQNDAETVILYLEEVG